LSDNHLSSQGGFAPGSQPSGHAGNTRVSRGSQGWGKFPRLHAPGPEARGTAWGWRPSCTALPPHSGATSQHQDLHPGGEPMIPDLWFRNAVIYSLDVDTFMDSDGDGIGDFEGLMRRLEYIEAL